MHLIHPITVLVPKNKSMNVILVTAVFLNQSPLHLLKIKHYCRKTISKGVLA